MKVDEFCQVASMGKGIEFLERRLRLPMKRTTLDSISEQERDTSDVSIDSLSVKPLYYPVQLW